MTKWPKQSLKRVWGCTPLAISLLMTPRQIFPQTPVQVSFQLEHSAVCAMQPVRVRIIIRNGSDEFVGIQPSLFADSEIDVWITEPGGKTIHPAAEMHGGFVLIPAVVVSPRETTVRSALVTQLFQFRKPGLYKLKIGLAGQIHLQSDRVHPKTDKVMPMEPQMLDLQVDPRNAQRLDEICRLLAKTATGLGEKESLVEAATDLSYVGDPTAVPYLKQLVAAHNPASPVAVRGLVRLATPQAMQALRSELASADGALKEQIEAGIREISTGERDQIMD